MLANLRSAHAVAYDIKQVVAGLMRSILPVFENTAKFTIVRQIQSTPMVCMIGRWDLNDLLVFSVRYERVPMEGIKRIWTFIEQYTPSASYENKFKFEWTWLKQYGGGSAVIILDR